MKVIESMCRVETFPLVVRVWRQEESTHDEYGNTDIRKVVEEHKYRGKAALANELAALPRVNAVEIVDKQTGCGLVIYPEWP